MGKMFLQDSNLNLYGWLDGFTATLIVMFGAVFSLIVLYKARKMNAKLLFYGSFVGLFGSLLWLGPCVDFFSVIATGKNLSPIGLNGILSYMWVAPAIIFGLYLGAELMLPEKKKIILVIYGVLSVIFELFLFLDTINAFKFEIVGGAVDTSFEYGHPTFILVLVFLLSVFIFVGLGSLRQVAKTTGVVRKKFIFMATASILFVIVGACDALLTPGPILFIIRMGMIVIAFMLYFALKP